MAVVSLDGRPIPPDLPRAQLAAIAHRGEREPRIWEAPGISLGHVNLPRTPEAERESLPASDATGRCWITWDGRLDNRDELAVELSLDAESGTRKTDAEYVLQAYALWGDDCVHHLLGDWAFVLWDSNETKLFLAKDPLGWRQLYYAEHDGLLAVGSEPAQFFARDWLPRVANEEYVLCFLADAVLPAGQTCYKDLNLLHGGRTVSVRRAAGTPSQTNVYWEKPTSRVRTDRSTADVVDEFRHLFQRAVHARLRSNRPAGVLLSGGLDSSYVAAVAAKHASVTALNAYAPGTKFDERDFALLVASHARIPVEMLDVSDCWGLNSSLVAHDTFQRPDLPVQASFYRKLGEAAKERGMGVLLAGDGADEWMTGAPSISESIVQRRFGAARAHALRAGSRSRVLRDLHDGLLPAALSNGLDRLRGRGASVRDRSYLSRAVRGQLAECGARVPAWRPSRIVRRNWERYRTLADTTVGWRDRHAFSPMGVELRTPFNDLRIIELMASVPESVKQFNGRTKDILREAHRGDVPTEITRRSDFGVLSELIIEPTWEREQERIQRATEAIGAFPGVDAAAAAERIAGWLTAPNNWDRDLTWRLVTCGLWLAHSGVQIAPSGVAGPRRRAANLCSQEGGDAI